MSIVLPALFSAFPGMRLDSEAGGAVVRDGSLTFGLESLPVVVR
jgi:hypothetical protein